MNAAQATAFQANAGFSASGYQSVVLVGLVAVLLLGVSGPCAPPCNLGGRTASLNVSSSCVAVRFVAMYVMLTFPVGLTR